MRSTTHPLPSRVRGPDEGPSKPGLSCEVLTEASMRRGTMLDRVTRTVWWRWDRTGNDPSVKISRMRRRRPMPWTGRLARRRKGRLRSRLSDSRARDGDHVARVRGVGLDLGAGAGLDIGATVTDSRAPDFRQTSRETLPGSGQLAEQAELVLVR